MSDWRRDTEQKILDVLTSDSPLGIVNIARTVGHHPITVENVCIHLQEKGQIRSIGGGIYEDATNRQKGT